MTFVQLMEYRTSKPDEVREVLREWERVTAGRRSARRILSTQHHGDSGRRCELVFFDSYDAARENSQLPETDEYARKLRSLVDGELTFLDLDVVEDQELG